MKSAAPLPNDPDDDDDLTRLFKLMKAGDDAAGQELFRSLYPVLKRMAIGRMKKERKDHTLQPTELVNELFLRLFSGKLSALDRMHFFAMAATVMRRILVDHARARLSEKRGSGRKEPLEDVFAYDQQRPEFLMDLDRALTKLEAMGPRQAKVVELRYFAGQSEEEIAETLGLSVRTVKRDWMMAKAWLAAELGKPDDDSADTPVPAAPGGEPKTPPKVAGAAASKG